MFKRRRGSMNRKNSELVCILKNPLWFASRVVEYAWIKDGCAYLCILASTPEPQYHFYAAFTATTGVLFTLWNLMMQPPRKQIAISIKIFERSSKNLWRGNFVGVLWPWCWSSISIFPLAITITARRHFRKITPLPIPTIYICKKRFSLVWDSDVYSI